MTGRRYSIFSEPDGDYVILQKLIGKIWWPCERWFIPGTQYKATKEEKRIEREHD